jgi:hypothetical protein
MDLGIKYSEMSTNYRFMLTMCVKLLNYGFVQNNE